MSRRLVGQSPGDRRKAMLEDIAILTGAQVVSEDLGIKLENVSLDMLGKAKKVTIAKDAAAIVDGSVEHDGIEGRTCSTLRAPYQRRALVSC